MLIHFAGPEKIHTSLYLLLSLSREPRSFSAGKKARKLLSRTSLRSKPVNRFCSQAEFHRENQCLFCKSSQCFQSYKTDFSSMILKSIVVRIRNSAEKVDISSR